MSKVRIYLQRIYLHMCFYVNLLADLYVHIFIDLCIYLIILTLTCKVR